ncbi:glutamine--tRNA ligase/YqeY domain fusion protein, partial [bacterium]|nr:glutamine--tRNA ligase/YqeY domain fusion protein [bacterium]
DIKWLGYNWEDRLFFASNYFEKFYVYAVQLIKKGKAFVCDLNAEEIRADRGSLTEPGKESTYRNRTIEENLDLFERMRNGEFPNGSRTLRAKIDMSSSNLNMRDPVIYRILHAKHHNTGDEWCIYPMYDWAHGLEDSIEGITHSLCTLEFEDHRPLYDWFLDELDVYHPQQIEFARLNLSYTVTSKRKLLELVEEEYVSSWDDPRMPTISGMRRRGYTPIAIRNFSERVGIAKRDNIAEMDLLEFYVREDLNRHAERRMVVIDPLKVIIENYPEGKVEELEAINNPEDESAGKRETPFSKEIYIEKSDFMEDPPKNFFRLGPDSEVRLRYAYFITCTDVIKNKNGEIIELRCTYDPETKGGSAPDGRKVKGTIHWVSAEHAIQAEVRLYDRLFTHPNPTGAKENDNFKVFINPNSLDIKRNCYLEPSLKDAMPEDRYQFERIGYFCVDRYDSKPDHLIFNRTATLRDTWARIQKS